MLDVWRTREEFLSASADLARLVERGAVASLDTLFRGGHSPRMRRRSAEATVSVSLPQSPVVVLQPQESPFAHEAEGVLAGGPQPKLSRSLAITSRSRSALLSVDDSLAGLGLRAKIERQADRDL